MLIQPKQDVIQALASLNNEYQFRVICDWLENTLNQIDEESATTKDEVQLRWNQGAAQVIREFLSKRNAALETLRKIQSR